MADVTFTITAGDPITGDLTLTSDGNANVQPNYVVEWILEEGAANIATIDRIEEDQGSRNLFRGEPARLYGPPPPPPAEPGTPTNNFSGTISPSVVNGQEETYHINWSDRAGNTHTFDPTLIVNT